MLNSSDPWEHHVEDNFLSQDEFNIVREYSSKCFYRFKTENRFHMVMSDLRFYKETRKDHELGVVVDRIFEQYRGWFEELYERNLSKFYMLKEFVIIDGNFHYPPHTDAPSKVISSILYVSDEGEGTRLSKNKKMEEPHQIEWKPNRLLSFARTKNTWHDYFCAGKRISFNLLFIERLPTNKVFLRNPTMPPSVARQQGLHLLSRRIQHRAEEAKHKYENNDFRS